MNSTDEKFVFSVRFSIYIIVGEKPMHTEGENSCHTGEWGPSFIRGVFAPATQYPAKLFGFSLQHTRKICEQIATLHKLSASSLFSKLCKSSRASPFRNVVDFATRFDDHFVCSDTKCAWVCRLANFCRLAFQIGRWKKRGIIF